MPLSTLLALFLFDGFSNWTHRRTRQTHRRVQALCSVCTESFPSWLEAKNKRKNDKTQFCWAECHLKLAPTMRALSSRWCDHITARSTAGDAGITLDRRPARTRSPALPHRHHRPSISPKKQKLMGIGNKNLPILLYIYTLIRFFKYI